MIGIEEKISLDNNRKLPDGWCWVRLGDVCDARSGGTPSRGRPDYYSGNIPWAKIEDLTRAGMFIDRTSESITEQGLLESSARLFPPGTLLFAMYGASIGTISITRINISTNQAILGCQCSSLLIPEFLWLWLSYIKPRLVALGVGGAQPNLNAAIVKNIEIPLPPLSEQQRIATIIFDQLVAVERAQAAIEDQLDLIMKLIEAELFQSFQSKPLLRIKLNECLEEVSKGVGENWKNYQLVGATRAGLAPAKENIGKNPGRYKLVNIGTIFYNPMRILLGSIAMIENNSEVGITSPDYVVFKTREGILDSTWFYYWLRSGTGEAFIKTLTRGAVRERMLFKRLASAEIDLPSWNTQLEISEKLKLIRQMKHTLQQQLSMISQLPGTLLRQIFSGDL